MARGINEGRRFCLLIFRGLGAGLLGRVILHSGATFSFVLSLLAEKIEKIDDASHECLIRDPLLKKEMSVFARLWMRARVCVCV